MPAETLIPETLNAGTLRPGTLAPGTAATGTAAAGTLTLGLLWHSMRSTNLGVGALTMAHMAILREAAAAVGARARFLVIGWTDPMPPYSTGPDIELAELRMRDFRPGAKLWRAARRCDLVLDIGGGDSFADIYGPGRIGRMLLAQAIVLANGRPLVLSPQTIGPFDRPWARRLALSVIRRARLVATRDALSTGFAREMGYRGPLIEATDVAFRLPYDAPAPRPAGPGGKVRVGINVSGLLVNGGYSRDNMFGLRADYPALTREMLGFFRDPAACGADCEVHLVSHVVAPLDSVESDVAAARALAAEHQGVIVAPAFATPSEAKSYIAGLDFFAGARMHACIAALSSGVPVLPIAYSRKFAGLFGTLGYHHTADCRTETGPEIMARLRAAFANRAGLKAEAEAAAAAAIARLAPYEDAVRGLMAGARARVRAEVRAEVPEAR
jgi:polysaccharide pyruvyl transferase WcaK-like protein